MYLAAAKLDKKARSNHDRKQIILGLFTKKGEAQKASPLDCELSHEDSNLDRQNQKL